MAEKTQISIWATPEETKRVVCIKRYHKRISKSDVLRFLIDQEYEKILNKNITNRYNKQEPAKE